MAFKKLEVHPRKGTVVADYSMTGTVDTLVPIMKYNGGQLPRGEVRSILELRRVLMSYALASAIPRLTGGQIESLKEQLALMGLPANQSDPEQLALVTFRYGHLLCGFSGNTPLPLIFSSFKTPLLALWERFFRLHGAQPIARHGPDDGLHRGAGRGGGGAGHPGLGGRHHLGGHRNLQRLTRTPHQPGGSW